MKFNLTAPCKDCPFRTDIPSQEGWLGYERAEGIAEAILNERQAHNTLKINKGYPDHVCKYPFT